MTTGDTPEVGLQGGDAAAEGDRLDWAPGTSAFEPEPVFPADEYDDVAEAVATESQDVPRSAEDVWSSERRCEQPILGDSWADTETCPGGVGCPCNSDDECDYPSCIQTADGERVCTGVCEGGCPSPLSCTPPASGDGPSLCLDDTATDCMPCTSTTACSQQGLVDAVCATEDATLGAFCGRRCLSNEDCGPGAVCAPGVLVETGESVSRCTPVEGVTCECSPLALALLAETRCVKGPSCTGVRRCTPDGLSQCMVEDEGPEVCDGLDNDCDGGVDNVPPTSCWPDQLKGLVKDGSSICHSGYRQCGACVDYQGPEEEICDQLDNDCDGVADEGLEVECVPPGTAKWLVYGDESRCRRGQSACGGPCVGFVGPLPDSCNGLDDDCDGEVDRGFPDTDADGVANCVDDDDDGDTHLDEVDDCPEVADMDQLDLDGDGLGDVCDPDDDGDGLHDEMDCAPRDGSRHVDAPEVCNGLDDNCNGTVDEGFPDLDGDGVMDACDLDRDGDGDLDEVDCAPTDVSRGPSAVEMCNGADENCDGQKDDGFSNLDGDAWGDPCDLDRDGDGTANVYDCAPDDPSVHRDVPESCNGLDDDCDGWVDEGQPDLDWDTVRDECDPDEDGDGDPDVTDCDERDPDVHHGMTEYCDGRDEDCSGAADDGSPDLDGDGVMDDCDPDRDGDGAPNDSDCAPGDPTRFPGALDVCNGLDDDCDDFSDEDFADLDHDGVGDECDWDRDGDGRANAFDCAPDDWARHPGRVEECNDVDDDCDGLVDDGPDLNGDGAWDACDPDADDDGILDSNDCAPFDGEVPRDGEVCNGKDDDCNGLIDEGGPDFDGDGIGFCDLDDDDDGWEIPLDCAPLRATGWPGAPELCNGLDDDCDELADEDWSDLDGDGFGDPCDSDRDGDFAPNDHDCAPDDPSVTPGAPELCNGKDDDCNGWPDDLWLDFDLDGFGGVCDDDDDDDGDPDATDCAPEDPTRSSQGPNGCG